MKNTKYMDNEVINRSVPTKHLKRISNRDGYIIGLCKDKKVLHIGASDWPFTKEKINRGCLLYANIGEVAKEQLGVDLDREASDFLNTRQIKNSHIEIRDMNELHTLSFLPDIIILGEVLEHLMNLDIALQNMRKIMRDDTKLVISVPNAFYFMNFVYVFIRREHQHPDHNVAFTYKTLTQLLDKADFKIDDFAFTFLASSSQVQYLNWKGKLMYALVRLFSYISPLFSETLLVSARKN